MYFLIICTEFKSKNPKLIFKVILGTNPALILPDKCPKSLPKGLFMKRNEVMSMPPGFWPISMVIVTDFVFSVDFGHESGGWKCRISAQNRFFKIFSTSWLDIWFKPHFLWLIQTLFQKIPHCKPVLGTNPAVILPDSCPKSIKIRVLNQISKE